MKTKIYVLTQWVFVLSMIWFTIGLLIISVEYMWILPIVPLVGLVTVGYINEIRKVKKEFRCPFKKCKYESRTLLHIIKHLKEKHKMEMTQ